ncbi:(Na+)-NQR maturation NqrM [Aurantimonas sp. A3-2-R12]|uniref:(Na+)-NQR maturation NqrM n=1 Tax=Aurantimonas sp. A3-2-R12 TaxID=3114362 RepID=UPI002E183E9F|nr:(Na+)-NQR maturation NqrM [Aurantimonas sp. A3-2-R12]
MGTFLLAFAIILLAIAGLALGVMFGRMPLRGSCGGLSCIKDAECGACRRRTGAGR